MPRQDSLHDQLEDLITIANQEGLLDAENWLNGVFRKTNPDTISDELASQLRELERQAVIHKAYDASDYLRLLLETR